MVFIKVAYLHENIIYYDFVVIIINNKLKHISSLPKALISTIYLDIVA